MSTRLIIARASMEDRPINVAHLVSFSETRNDAVVAVQSANQWGVKLVGKAPKWLVNACNDRGIELKLAH